EPEKHIIKANTSETEQRTLLFSRPDHVNVMVRFDLIQETRPGPLALGVLPLPHVRLGRRAKRHAVANVLVEEIELDLGAHRIVEKHLVARVLDVLLLEIDADLLQVLAELSRAGSLERDVIHAAGMSVLYDRALREARADVDDGVVAVVEPDAAELKFGTVTRLQAEHIAVDPLDLENIRRE